MGDIRLQNINMKPVWTIQWSFFARWRRLTLISILPSAEEAVKMVNDDRNIGEMSTKIMCTIPTENRVRPADLCCFLR
jgi:hypothetical protein